MNLRYSIKMLRSAMASANSLRYAGGAFGTSPALISKRAGTRPWAGRSRCRSLLSRITPLRAGATFDEVAVVAWQESFSGLQRGFDQVLRERQTLRTTGHRSRRHASCVCSADDAVESLRELSSAWSSSGLQAAGNGFQEFPVQIPAAAGMARVDPRKPVGLQTG
jgi:hypothetical protein